MTKYDKHTRMRVVAAFEAFNGDFELTSEYTGVAYTTIKTWSQEEWWKVELHDSSPIRDKRLAALKIRAWDAAFAYVERLMSPEVVNRMPIDKLMIAFGILVDKIVILERGVGESASSGGDVYSRLVNSVFGDLLDNPIDPVVPNPRVSTKTKDE